MTSHGLQNAGKLRNMETQRFIGKLCGALSVNTACRVEPIGSVMNRPTSEIAFLGYDLDDDLDDIDDDLDLNHCLKI